MELWKYLKDKMLKNPNQSICEDNANISFAKAVEIVEAFAEKLQGIKCCAILCEHEMAAGVALLSCFAAGVTAIPLSKRYGEIHCGKILDAIRPDAMITDDKGYLNIIRIDNSSYKEPKVHPAIIMCTSGTTGIPKGAMLSELNILTNVNDIIEYFNVNYGDSILISRPLYHCAVLTGEFLTALVKGVKIRFYSGKFNPAIVLKLLKKYQITAFCGTPTLLTMMSHFKRTNDYSLRHICISGECMGMETGRRIANSFLDADIYHIYGLTEASPRVSYLPPKLFKEYPDCVGVPLKSVALKILSSDGQPVGINEIGTLWVKGANVMIGYYNDPIKTEEVIKDGWLCTGDMALFNEVGLVKIKGRADDLIIKAGMNIYPQEIEDALKVDSRVMETYVFGKKDERYGTLIVLNIAGDFKEVSEIKELCKKCLADYQIPTCINFVDKLSKNGSGKVIRQC